MDYISFSSLKEAFTGQDAIVNSITGGATQYEPSKLIIDAAVEAGVKFFFANEFVGYVESEQYKRLPEAFVGAKVRMRNYLEGLGKEGKIAWTSLNGGPFFDMCEYLLMVEQNWIWLISTLGLMKGPAGFDIANRRARIYGTGANPLYWTPLPTIGLAVANMLRNPAPILNRPIYICPFVKTELTQSILFNTLESILNVKFEVEKVDVKKIHWNAMIALERGEAAKAMKGFAVANQFYEEDCGNDFSHLVENETVGVEILSVEDAVKDAIARYGEDCKIVEGMFRVEPCEV